MLGGEKCVHVCVYARGVRDRATSPQVRCVGASVKMTEAGPVPVAVTHLQVSEGPTPPGPVPVTVTRVRGSVCRGDAARL